MKQFHHVVAGLSILALGACGTDGAGTPEVGPDATPGVEEAGPVSITGATIVSYHQMSQTWGQSDWDAPGTITLTGVQAGDAILVLGSYWVSSGTGSAPSDSGGHLTAAVNQIARGYNPPVAAQIYYELGAAAGTHVITPAFLDYGGDGTTYVVQVRGLAGTAVGHGDSHADGTALPSVSTHLSTSALAGDFVCAVGGEDDEVAFGPNAGMSGPPAGWQSVGVENNAEINTPSAAYCRVVSSSGTQPVTFTWADDTVNVTDAAIAAFR